MFFDKGAKVLRSCVGNGDEKIDIAQSLQVIAMILCRLGRNQFGMGNRNRIVKDRRDAHLPLSRVIDHSINSAAINKFGEKKPLAVQAIAGTMAGLRNQAEALAAPCTQRR